MGDLTSFLIIYLLGGLTFIPLLFLALVIHAYFTFPIHDESDSSIENDSILRPGDSPDVIRPGGGGEDVVKPGGGDGPDKGADEKFQSRANPEVDVAAGYFAVCREYVPGGVNGKPPERTTPVGSTAIASPSPSVYQSMYRSIFDRRQTASPLDNKGAGRPQKRGGNVFYVVLRHSHLLLFDDEDMLVVKFVLSLDHHDISIYSGGETIPDGELFIKRNAICLTRNTAAGKLTAVSKPFFLFADNTSDKEDFYFAMLRSQERGSGNGPTALQLEVKDIVALVRRLHSSEEHMQTRWFNAIIGRIFLGLYKTSDVENFIRAKIAKKISRVKKPSYLSGIVVRNVYMGDGAPYVTNPRLKDLTVDGDCVIEADISYAGNFRLEVATTAKIELGTRFNRTVNLLLAVVLQKVEGHILLRVKPPPSNRIWFTFQKAPKIEMSVHPIVSSRQITYTMILRQIENRIKEVVAESIVLPYWDDIAFLSTEGKKWRGGVWADDALSHDVEAAVEDGDDAVEHLESENATANLKSMSAPGLVESRSSEPGSSSDKDPEQSDAKPDDVVDDHLIPEAYPSSSRRLSQQSDQSDTTSHSHRQDYTSSSDSVLRGEQEQDKPSDHQDSASMSTASTNKSDNLGAPARRTTLTTVAATAKRWSLNALQRKSNQNKDGKDISLPMGRGRPLPPPGIPLPPPDRKAMIKRKPVSAPKGSKPAGPPPVPRRPDDQTATTAVDDGLFVVAAPPESEPTTPLDESRLAYLAPWVDDDEEGNPN